MTAQATTGIWDEYQQGVDYQADAQFTTKWPEYERFRAFDQWATVTEATATLPRPVLNIIDYLISQKISNISSAKLRMVYMPSDIPNEKREFVADAAQNFTDYAAEVGYSLEQERLNADALLDAATLGPGFWHYYWDNTQNGGYGGAPGVGTKFRGALAGETIDPSCIFFGDPQCTEVQRQPYIIIASRMDTELAKNELSKYGEANKTVIRNMEGDSEDSKIEIYDSERNQRRNTKKTTILTKYSRKDGFVYMEKACKSDIVLPATALKGNRLYPIEVFRWCPVKRSIYGRGECEGLIPAQKAINLIYAMLLLCLQDMGFPKVISYPGALRGQRLNGKIGQMLTNYASNPEAVKYLNPPQFNNAAFSVVDNLIGYIKTLSGVTEGLTGERIVSDMAAGAIMAIQAQAKQPLRTKELAFYRSQTNIGKIWEEFFKNYMDLPRPMVVKNDIGVSETRVFTGSDYKEVPFTTRVEVGPASEYSEALSTSTLDKAYTAKDIDFATYVELAPPNAVPWRTEFQRIMSKQQDQVQVISALMQTGRLAPDGLMLLVASGIIKQQVADQVMQSMPPPMDVGANGGAPAEMPPE